MGQSHLEWQVWQRHKQPQHGGEGPSMEGQGSGPQTPLTILHSETESNVRRHGQQFQHPGHLIRGQRKHVGQLIGHGGQPGHFEQR